MTSPQTLEQNYVEFCQNVAWTGLRYTDREGIARVRPLRENAPRLVLAKQLALFLRDMIVDGEVEVVLKTQDDDGFTIVESRKTQKHPDPDTKEQAMCERMRTLVLMLFGPGDDTIATAMANRIKRDEKYVLDSIAKFRTYSDQYGNENSDTFIALLEEQCGRRYAT
jgi:hypothetical protein